MSNGYLAKMYGRCMTVDHTGFARMVTLVNQLFRGWDRHICGSSQFDRDIHGLYAKQQPHLNFTKREELRGRETMRKWGIPEGAKWVCLIVRDEAYLPELTYHSYRDSEIKTYILAVMELVARGYYVFRMGAKVKKPLQIKHPMVIDYAWDGRGSDFMGIYLGAHCSFCVSNGTGYDAIPVVFRKPVCFVNYVPIEYLNTWVKSVAIWKHHFKDGKRMSLQEIWDSKCGQFMSSDQFKEAGISLVDNTQDEIARAAVEMVAIVEGWAELKDQSWFWKQFPRSISTYNSRPLHGEIRMRIGEKFLEGYEPLTLDRAA